MSPLEALIDLLASLAVEDYLREAANAAAGSAPDAENPPLPPRREAA